MVILIDMDNVVADLMTKWLTVYNQQYNDDLKAEQITAWNMEKFARKCSPNEFYQIVEKVGFFSDLQVFPYAVEVTQRLQQAKHDLWFVTATPYGNPTGGYDKQNWVDRYFPHIGKSRVIQTHNKQMIKGDVLFDDGPTNLINFLGIKVAMDFPYNRDVSVNYRVRDWLEFEKTIHNIINMRKPFREV